MKRIFTLFLLLLILPGIFLVSRSLWQERDLFTNRRRLAVGDIIKIRFDYKNLIRYRNTTKTGNSKQINVARPGVKTFSFLPAFDLAMTGKDDNSVEYSTEKEFNARIAVRITEAMNNGNLRFRGEHTIVINGQSEGITILGMINPEDLRDGNQVLAQDIADLQFSYNGPQPLQRNLIRPADLVYSGTNRGVTNTAATNGRTRENTLPDLTREARQRLILDYLNRIASLLFSR